MGTHVASLVLWEVIYYDIPSEKIAPCIGKELTLGLQKINAEKMT